MHVNDVVGWTAVDRPLIEVPPTAPSPVDEQIAAHVAPRIPDGATIQAGIGAIPNALLAGLRGHRDLGVHTELLSDALVDLIERGVVTGSRKRLARGRSVTTFALGTQRLYDFLHENAAVEFLPVDHVNDPRVIAEEDCFVSINATTEVDLIGQCASETVGGRYWSSSGGQADFARGAMYSPHGKAFVVLPSTAVGGSVSRIRATLSPGSVVTTLKNTVDHIVTEHGVAEMRGRSISAAGTGADRDRRPPVPRRPHQGSPAAQLPLRASRSSDVWRSTVSCGGAELTSGDDRSCIPAGGSSASRHRDGVGVHPGMGQRP